jgi:hypothetical protein
MATLIQPPFPVFTDIDGDPLNDGFIYIGVANLNPIANPVAVFWDAALTIPAIQPIRTQGGYPLQGSGPRRLYTVTNYSILVRNKNNTVVYSNLNSIDYFNFGNGVVLKTDTIADLRLIWPPVGSVLSIQVSGYNSIGDGGGGPVRYWIDSAAPGTYVDNGGSVIVPTGGDGSAAWLWSDENNIINASWFGILDNTGVTDYAIQISNLFNIAAHKSITWLEGGGDYLTSTTQVLPRHANLNLNGVNLRFELNGAVKCLDLRGNNIVENGSIENNSINPVSSGDFQCPIIIGNYAVGTGYDSIALRELIIKTNRPNGNGIMITGDSHNIHIENVIFPASVDIGRPILIHWGGATVPAAGTTHPYNITINNIKCDDATGMPTADGAVIFLSAVYNVVVKNIFANNISGSGMYIYAGDYGSIHAPADIQSLIGTGISIDAVAFTNVGHRGLWVNGNGPLGNILSLPITAQNIRAIGAAGSNHGILLAYCSGVWLENLDINSFGLHGIAPGDQVFRVRISGGRIWNNQQTGIHATNNASPPADWVIENVEIYLNNQSGGVAFHGIDLTTHLRPIIRNCRFGAVGEAQINSIKGSVATISPYIASNYTFFIAGTHAYILGAGTDYVINPQGEGNLAAPGITLYDGVAFVRYNERGQRTRESSAAPASGAWIKGDRTFNSNPNTGATGGWICTGGGSPGTWKPFGPIQFVDTYTPSNVTPDRAFDADTVAVDELADVVGTLIADLKTAGLIS